MNELEVLITLENYMVVCLVEHWLTEDNKSLYTFNGYNVASIYCRKQHIHGGTAIYTASFLKYYTIPVDNFCIEMHFEVCAIKLIDFKIILVALYRPCNGNVALFFNQLELFLDFLSRFKCDIVFCGDINIEACGDDQNTLKLHNILRSEGLYSTNSKPTRSTACIDYMITNISPKFYRSEVLDLPISDHSFMLLTINDEKSINGPLPSHCDSTPQNVKVRKLHATAIEDFTNHLLNLDWETILSGLDSESMYDLFHSIFIYWMNVYLPARSVKVRGPSKRKDKDKNKYWYSADLMRLKNFVMALYTKFKNSKLETDRQVYVNARNMYKRALLQAKKAAYDNEIASAQNKTKAAWNIIKRESGHSSIPIAGPNAADFSSYLTSAIEEVRSDIVPGLSTAAELLQLPHAPNQTFEWQAVLPSDVCNVVSKFKCSRSCDIYECRISS
jgi:hypothetical protein